MGGGVALASQFQRHSVGRKTLECQPLWGRRERDLSGQRKALEMWESFWNKHCDTNESGREVMSQVCRSQGNSRKASVLGPGCNLI